MSGKSLQGVALALLIIAPGVWAQSPDTSAGDQVDRIVAQDMAARKTPGLSVAVIQDGKLVKEASYGVASVELGVPVTNGTLYTLASTTKEFTGVAIMTLVEQGKLSLDDSIRKYLPELPASWAPVTIRQCLAHTSGLPDGDAPDNVNVTPLAGTRAELLALLADKPVQAPGVKAIYNQTEYMVLGDIIERVSGMPYKTYIDERLLKPVGITSMRWGDAWTIVPGRSSLYTTLAPTSDRSKLQIDAKGEPVQSTEGIHAFGSKAVTEWLMPAAGLSGNIEAMARWETALWGGKVIRPASLALMGQPFKLRDGKPGDFGLAVMPDVQDGIKTIHTGGGAAVWLTTMPEKHLTVIVLTNLQGSSPAQLVAKILDVYVGKKH